MATHRAKTVPSLKCSHAPMCEPSLYLQVPHAAVPKKTSYYQICVFQHLCVKDFEVCESVFGFKIHWAVLECEFRCSTVLGGTRLLRLASARLALPTVQVVPSLLLPPPSSLLFPPHDHHQHTCTSASLAATRGPDPIEVLVGSSSLCVMEEPGLLSPKRCHTSRRHATHQSRTRVYHGPGGELRAHFDPL